MFRIPEEGYKPYENKLNCPKCKKELTIKAFSNKYQKRKMLILWSILLGTIITGIVLLKFGNDRGQSLGGLLLLLTLPGFIFWFPAINNSNLLNQYYIIEYDNKHNLYVPKSK